MMRLFYTLFDSPIEIKENEVNVFVLESQKCFREFLYETKQAFRRAESKLKLSKNYEEIHFDKYVFPIFSMESIDANSKKILTKVYSDLKEIAYSENMYIQTTEIVNQMMLYTDDLIHHSEINLVYDDFDIDVCLKAMNIKIETNEKDFVQTLCTYVDVISEVLNIQVFLFFHLKEYIEEEELLEFYKHCNYRKIKLLLCENTARPVLPGEKLMIIDRDLCQIC